MIEQTLTPARADDHEIILTICSGQIVFVVTVLLAAALAWTYFATQRVVALTIDGRALELRTHQQSIGALFNEYGFMLSDADIVLPPLDTPLERAGQIRLWLAQPVEVEADGQVVRAFTPSGSVADVLQELDIRLGRYDYLVFNGDPLPVNTLIHIVPVELDPRTERTPVHLSVQRAIAINMSDDGVAATLYTFATTVGDVLRAYDVRVHPGDRISPNLDQPVSAGLRIFIERSKPLTIVADGKTIQARTREPTIGQTLTAEGVHLQGQDYTIPPAISPVHDNAQVQVVRVREELIEEASAIPYPKLLQPDDNLEIDQQRTAQRGQHGEHRKLIRVVYENGQEVRRVVEKEWDSRAPTPLITAYGRKIVAHELITPNGPIQYWRVVRMYATSYSPVKSGTHPDKGWYGRTSAGLKAGKGVVAIDQSIVPWLSRVYVPDYGIAIAGDTGGGVRGRIIDLGFDDDNYESWHDWVDVYLLWPPPSPQDIRYILPNTPVERRRN